MFVEYYTENWPLVYIKFVNTNVNDESFEFYKKEYLKILLRCKEERQKIFVFYDLNVKEISGNIPISHLQKQIEFNKEVFSFNEKYVKAILVLSKDIHVRNILKLSFGCIKNASPFKISSSFEKVSRYLKKNFDVDFDPNLFRSCDKNSTFQEIDNNDSENPDEEENDNLTDQQI